jgi:hypothetical protein
MSSITELAASRNTANACVPKSEEVRSEPFQPSIFSRKNTEPVDRRVRDRRFEGTEVKSTDIRIV